LERLIPGHLRSCRCWSQRQGLAGKDKTSASTAGSDRGDVCGTDGLSTGGDRGQPWGRGRRGGLKYGGEGDNAEDVNRKVGKGRLYMGTGRAWLSVSKGALF
jgi:hypothetical protein